MFGILIKQLDHPTTQITHEFMAVDTLFTIGIAIINMHKNQINVAR